jgi:Fic family protein
MVDWLPLKWSSLRYGFDEGGFDGKLTSSKWAELAKCSQDTAPRDIDNLLGRGILVRDAVGGGVIAPATL